MAFASHEWPSNSLKPPAKFRGCPTAACRAVLIPRERGRSLLGDAQSLVCARSVSASCFSVASSTPSRRTSRQAPPGNLSFLNAQRAHPMAPLRVVQWSEGDARRLKVPLDLLAALHSSRTELSLTSVKRAMKMPSSPRESGHLQVSFSVKQPSLRLSLSPTEPFVPQQSSCGRWRTLFVS